MGQRPPRGDHFQRIAAGDARRGGGFHADVSDVGASRHRRLARRLLSVRLPSEAACAKRSLVPGRPLLTGLALEHITAAHSIVFIGLLPLATAAFGVLRGSERPKPAFWLFSVLGAATVAAFALSRSGAGSLAGDLLMVAAILLCGLGYAEGAALSRRLGGWQVISWALLLSLPVMAAITLFTSPANWSGIEMPAWLSLGYVSIFSMFVGFVFWYRGLALGGIVPVPSGATRCGRV
jgi:drug/metabolite transporter (DMT)-like permease